MGNTRRHKIAMKIKKGATLYSYKISKRVKAVEDIIIEAGDIMHHDGHIRFNFKGQRYAYVYNENRGKYEDIFA